MSVATIQRKSGPRYKSEPVDGFYEWECPVCGCVQSDPQHIHETTCGNGHEVRLAVAGCHEDGWCMCAETVPEED
jgi:hypothetical protein